MPVKIEFSTANAAFADGGLAEVSTILRQIADSCERDVLPKGGAVRDTNGNTIGQWSATIDAETEPAD